jgi:23S rRNA (cytidine1920-2'-O)/16S rRNA (cytidine1409-2'-O)-methyltransferase
VTAQRKYVSRAGLKLEHALAQFETDVTGLSCADFGCNIGGFTDCLLQHGADQVVALDTGYGVLDYTLRTDPRVTVRERTNILHAQPTEPVDLVTIDLAWTRQHRSIPVALTWLKPGGRIITLLKPHYELEEHEKRTLLDQGMLPEIHVEPVVERTLTAITEIGVDIIATTRSPITGGKSAKRRSGEGNVESLALLQPR